MHIVRTPADVAYDEAPLCESTQRREEMPSDLAGQVPAAVYTARSGADGAWLYASPQIEQILGYAPAEFLDDPGLWARLLHPEDRDWVLAGEAVDAQVVGEERSYSEYRMVARGERVVWVLDDTTVIEHAEYGSVQHGILVDITQRKTTELLLAEQADVLERIARGATLEETLQALAESLVRVTGAETCAVGLADNETTFVAGLRDEAAQHVVERVAFAMPDGTVLGELLLLGVESRPGPRSTPVGLSLGWAQRLAVLAVDRARQDEREAESYSLLEATLEATADGILVVDPSGRVISYNEKFRHMWGIPRALVEKRDDDVLLNFVMDQVVDREEFMAVVRRVFAQPELCTSDELHFHDGRTFERASQPQRLDGRPVGTVWSFRDVTQVRALESELRHQAHTDALTSLPNRHRFMQRLTELSRRHSGPASPGSSSTAVDGPVAPGYALLLIDVDDFKTVNDGLGHLAGDALLIALGERVSGCVRIDDMTARLGGDEFAVLVKTPAGVQDAIRIAERIGEQLALPLDIDGRVLSIRASIGIALSDGVTPARDLVRNADLAMYTAKREGGACYRRYISGMHDVAISRLDLKADLERAIDEHSFDVVYQPVVSLASGKIDGLEALARWEHPTLGPISPIDFIPLAEETGLIARFGHEVLVRVCADVASWRESLGDRVPPVSVNLSPRQLTEPDLAGRVGAVIAAHGLPPQSICLEVTETALGQTGSDISACLDQIHDQGVRLALDDFGTGHSSLARLSSYPFDIIKIDRSFVVGLTEGTKDSAVVQAVLRLADAFSLDVIAEGVETTGQRDVLAGLGCPRVQGFLFSRPVSGAETLRMLTDGRVLG